MHETCCGCPHHTPNGECYIGQIENCPLDRKEMIGWVCDIINSLTHKMEEKK